MVVVRITNAEQKLPSWKKFLAFSTNKVSLVEFLLDQWKQPLYAAELYIRSLFVCHGNDCECLTSSDGQTVTSRVVNELHCWQEEADTRMFLHANHAAENGADTVIVKSPATDVAVIGCFFDHCISAKLMLTGTKNR